MPFRTYSSREQSLDCTLVEAACATLAIPPHFDSVLVGPPFRGKKFSSACIGFNNITRELLKEAGKQFGQNRRVSTILSIGAGHTSTLKHTSLPNPDSYYDLLKRIATDSEKVARELSAQLFNVDAYFRLNVDYGMENIDLNNWTGLGEIESQTDVYLQGTAVDNAIDSSLRSLESKPGMITLEQLSALTIHCLCLSYLFLRSVDWSQGPGKDCTCRLTILCCAKRFLEYNGAPPHNITGG